MHRNARLQDLEQLLIRPREELSTEYKQYLDLGEKLEQATLIKAIMAIANSGGGYVVLGFSEVGRQLVPQDENSTLLATVSQDGINNLIKKYAEPRFHCRVEFVIHPQLGSKHPIIDIPGGHKGPIRCKADDPQRKHLRANEYYVRKPGPESEPARTEKEWSDLIGECVRNERDTLLASFQALLQGSLVNSEPSGQDQLAAWTERSEKRFEIVTSKVGGVPDSRYAHGYWMFAYRLEGDFDKVASPASLREMISRSQGRGWPPWLSFPTNPLRTDPDTLSPYIETEEGRQIIECWLRDTQFQDAAHSDFWRADAAGPQLFLLRGYRDDCERQITPGTLLDPILVIGILAECLLHALRLAEHVSGGDIAKVTVHARVVWKGLKGRCLSTWANPMRPLFVRPVCRASEQASTLTVAASTISPALAQHVGEMIRPLLSLFDFFELSQSVIDSVIQEMKR